jgi:hypothetical protein
MLNLRRAGEELAIFVLQYPGHLLSNINLGVDLRRYVTP